MIQTGMITAGRYRILREIGRGGMDGSFSIKIQKAYPFFAANKERAKQLQDEISENYASYKAIIERAFDS